MRKWGVVISILYAAIVMGMLVPLGVLLVDGYGLWSGAYYRDVWDTYAELWVWIPVVLLVVAQAVLLFLSVDTSQRRLKPRVPVVRSVVVASLLVTMLTVAAVLSVGVAIRGDHLIEGLPDSAGLWALGTWAALWAGWGVVFYLYLRGKTETTNRIMRWLLRGSILELLIAVPSHVMVRRREECCAPMVSSLGITMGIAIMLLSFGPSVLLLYKKRLDAYRTAGREHHAAAH